VSDSSSDQDKTEEPTAQRLQRAADEGEIPTSTELGTAAILLGAALSLRFAMPPMAGDLTAYLGDALRQLTIATDRAALVGLLITGGREAVLLTLVLAGGISLLVLLATGVQGRGTLSLTPIEPKWSRLDPIANGQRLLSPKALVDLLKAVGKLVLVGTVAGVVLSDAWPELMDLGAQGPAGLVTSVGRHVGRLVLLAALAYVGLAAGDYGWQWWQQQQQLRMTKDEVKRELKQSDGDPLLKARMRSLARARVRRQMMKDVPQADVVIVNPTRRAIALRYDPLTAPAPVVLAMGERKVAERIRAIAEQHGVPIIENRPLAIALLASARVGMMIPADLYTAVAEVLAFVFRQRALAGRGAA
jgi:flagellar biosynthetic protein FlhB